MLNAPSLANCDFMTLSEQVSQLVEGGVDLFHVDIMDGHYVPNLCFPVKFIADLKSTHPSVPVDAHLMVTHPAAYLDPLAAAGADYVSFPADSTPFIRRTITQIHERGMRAGVAINPSQRVDVVEPYLGLLDYVVLMTVEPGFAGQRFLDGSLERLEDLAALRERTGSKALIQIDGGVDYAMGEECLRRGADILVTGIYTVFNQEDGIVSAVRRFGEVMAGVDRRPRLVTDVTLAPGAAVG